jgi:hypothetical protein
VPLQSLVQCDHCAAGRIVNKRYKLNMSVQWFTGALVIQPP